MNSTWYNVAVVLLWLATMSWLISQKVMPSLLVGEAPSYRTIVEARQEEPTGGWWMLWNDRRIGWAVDKTSVLPNEMTEVRSLVHFDELPLDEMIPKPLLQLLLQGDGSNLRLRIEARSKLIFDPLKRLSQFESSVGLEGMDDAVKVRGTLDGSELHVSVRSGEFTYETESVLPGEALLSDALSPQSKLPGLRDGQSWNVEIFSPLRPRNDPVEVLQATVEGTEHVEWGTQVVEAWLVVYRTDPGAGAASARVPRGRLWVREDGTVLKQEANLFDSTITFVRLPQKRAAALIESVGDWK